MSLPFERYRLGASLAGVGAFGYGVYGGPQLAIPARAAAGAAQRSVRDPGSQPNVDQEG